MRGAVKVRSTYNRTSAALTGEPRCTTSRPGGVRVEGAARCLHTEHRTRSGRCESPPSTYNRTSAALTGEPRCTTSRPGGARTLNLRIKSPLLYQLSYRPISFREPKLADWAGPSIVNRRAAEERNGRGARSGRD